MRKKYAFPTVHTSIYTKLTLEHSLYPFCCELASSCCGRLLTPRPLQTEIYTSDSYHLHSVKNNKDCHANSCIIHY